MGQIITPIRPAKLRRGRFRVLPSPPPRRGGACCAGPPQPVRVALAAPESNVLVVEQTIIVKCGLRVLLLPSSVRGHRNVRRVSASGVAGISRKHQQDGFKIQQQDSSSDYSASRTTPFAARQLLCFWLEFPADVEGIPPLLQFWTHKICQELSPGRQLTGNSSDSNGDYSDSEGLDLTELDSLAFLEVNSDHEDSDNEADWDEVAKEEFQDRLFRFLAQIEEDRQDAGDSDWIPSRQASEAKRAAEKRKPGGINLSDDLGEDDARWARTVPTSSAKRGKPLTKKSKVIRVLSRNPKNLHLGAPPEFSTTAQAFAAYSYGVFIWGMGQRRGAGVYAGGGVPTSGELGMGDTARTRRPCWDGFGLTKEYMNHCPQWLGISRFDRLEMLEFRRKIFSTAFLNFLFLRRYIGKMLPWQFGGFATNSPQLDSIVLRFSIFLPLPEGPPRLSATQAPRHPRRRPREAPPKGCPEIFKISPQKRNFRQLKNAISDKGSKIGQQDDGVIGIYPPKFLKNAISGQGFGNFGLKNAKFGQGNGQISASKTQFFGQPFGGASRGLTACQARAELLLEWAFHAFQRFLSRLSSGACERVAIYLQCAFAEAFPTYYAKYTSAFKAGVWETADPGPWLGRAIVYKLQVGEHVDGMALWTTWKREDRAGEIAYRGVGECHTHARAQTIGTHASSPPPRTYKLKTRQAAGVAALKTRTRDSGGDASTIHRASADNATHQY
ncbi:hypothetical protein B0H14DRAFT_3162834 [Mycena olivaceomarginata]|nr:hypothetical protein B0H14DRAFT_3162834 [Mycena olivaceomarginata]